jgi:hypothetical protein
VRHDLLAVNQLVHRVVFTAVLLWNQLFFMVVGHNKVIVKVKVKVC